MEPHEYTETFDRLTKIVGRTIARQIVDEMDDERTAAKAEEERIRTIVRQELGLLLTRGEKAAVRTPQRPL